MGADGKAPTVYIETVLIVRPIKVLALLAGVFGCFLLMLSASATAWLQASDSIAKPVEPGDMREGLWERCKYGNKSVKFMWCNIAFDRGHEWVVACQVLCLLSILICLSAIVVTSLGLRTDDYKIKYKLYWGGLVMFFIAVLVEIISLVFFPVKFLEEVPLRQERHWSFGWAYIVGWVGAGMEFCAGLMILLDRGAEEVLFRERVAQEDDDDGIEARV